MVARATLVGRLCRLVVYSEYSQSDISLVDAGRIANNFTAHVQERARGHISNVTILGQLPAIRLETQSVREA